MVSEKEYMDAMSDLAKAEAEVERLWAVLQPFAAAAKAVDKIGLAHACAVHIKASHLEAAANVLEQKG